jgi:hypothetical protein
MHATMRLLRSHAAAAACALAALAAWPAVDGHSSLLIPPPRNAVDKDLPPWSKGSFGQGSFGDDAWGCNCINATTKGPVPCEVGQSCFWFSNGCSIGCPACDGGNSSGTNPNTRDRCGSGAKATLNPALRTFNKHTVPGSDADIYKHNPWRAPGTAPVFDACGMAGGNWRMVGGEAKYSKTVHAKQGDLGSKVLPPAPSGTVWRAGGTEQTAITIRANHGGGYSFRLCPASEPLTEACMQKLPLAFVPGRQTLRWSNGTSLVIRGNYTTDGTSPKGSSWAQNPLPYSNAGNPPEFKPPCHERSGCAAGVGAECKPAAAAACAPKPLSSGAAEGYTSCANAFCSTGKEYAFAGNVSLAACVAQCKAHNCTCFDYSPTSSGHHPFEHCRVAALDQHASAVPSSAHYTAYRLGANPPAPPPSKPHGGLVSNGFCSGEFPFMSMILDEVSIPADTKPGDYVLGFRWDCEKSAQVWAACADVTIVGK